MSKRDVLLERLGAALVALVNALVDLVLFVALLLAQALRVAVVLLPGALRLGCIAAAIGAAVVTFGPVFIAYGGEPVSIIPALCVVLSPVAFALQMGGRGFLWGALIVAALCTWGAGAAIVALPVALRGLVIVGVLGAILFYFVTKPVEVTNESQEW